MKLHSLEWAARAVGLDSRFVNSRSSYSSYGLVLVLVRRFWGAFALFKIVFITFNVIKNNLSVILLSWEETWVANFATQNLSELILTWAWILCSCNDFHAECTQTGQLSRLNCWVAFLQSALSYSMSCPVSIGLGGCLQKDLGMYLAIILLSFVDR